MRSANCRSITRYARVDIRDQVVSQFPCRIDCVSVYRYASRACFSIADATIKRTRFGIAPRMELHRSASKSLPSFAVEPCRRCIIGMMQILADAQVAERVVVIVEQARDPGHETELGCVVVEAVPEDALCGFGRERGELVAAATVMNSNLVVDVPVLEAA